MYIHRDLEEPLKEALQQFPAVMITGPRQAGKSTLLQTCLPDYTYVPLDDPDMRQRVMNDPKLFIRSQKGPFIFDEIQYAPDLLQYLKVFIDANRDVKGQFVLTGSQVFQLMEGVSESLAGRICIFQLYPLSWAEVGRAPSELQVDVYDEKAVATRILQGFYPEVFKHPEFNWARWYGSYIATYLERDVRSIRAVADLDLFQKFLTLLATRVGNLLNLTELAKECGISQPTARQWVSILESTYVIFRLRPYFNNHGKRMVKSPKLYFVDPGLACFLLGIDSPDRFFRAKESGHLFENMVIADCMKRSSLLSRPKQLHFYRTAYGVEVDLLVDKTPFEIKFAHRLTPRMTEPLEKYLAGHKEESGFVLYLGEQSYNVTENIEARHWSSLTSTL